MHIAILTFQGFNELDSFIALGVLNRVKKPGWRVTICCPEPTVTSMNGVTVQAQSTLAEARSADAVIVGSGIKTREIVEDPELIQLDDESADLEIAYVYVFVAPLAGARVIPSGDWRGHKEKSQ